MITSYEVGAVLRVIDDVSPAIARMAIAVRDFDKLIVDVQKSLSKLSSTRFSGLTTRIGNVNKVLGDSAVAGDAAAKALVTGFGRVDAAIATSMGNVKALQTSIGQLSASQRLLAGGGGPAAGGGGRAGLAQHVGQGGGGGHWGRMGVGQHGVTAPHFSMPSTPWMAAVAALGYGVYLEGNAEDQLARMILTGQMNSDAPMVGTPQFDQARQTLQRISSSTGIGVHDVGDAMLGVERQMGGLPFDKRIALEETIAPFAASEAKLKETSFKETFEAMVGLAHMTGTYDPAKLPELMRQFSYASLITPAGIPQFRNALSYSMPILHSALDMDPSSVMFLTSMMQTAGVTNSKSGTWLRSFFERSYAPLGDSKADLQKVTALHNLGMIDGNRNAIWESKGPDGKVNWDQSIVKLTGILSNYLSHHTTEEKLQNLRDAFGERGGGFGALMNLPEFIAQFPVLQAKMKAFKGGGDVMTYLNENSPTQQYNKTMADTQIALMDLGKTVMPSVIQGIKDLDKGIRDSSVQIKAFAAAFQPAIDALYRIGGVISGAIGVLRGDPTVLPKALSGGTDPGAQQRLDHFKALNPTGTLGKAGFVQPRHPNGLGFNDPPYPAKQSSNDQPIHIKTAIYLDGRAIGENTSMHLARASTFPTQAAYGDSYLGWNAPDNNFATG